MNTDELLSTQQAWLRATCTGCARSLTATSAAERCPDCGGLLFVQTAPLEQGFLIEGKYEIEKEVGVGSWGTVYVGKQIGLERKVAIKVLHRHLVLSPGKFERFRMEAESLKQLNHSGVAAIYDVGVLELPDGEQPFFVQEFVSGETLRDILRKEKLSGAQIKALFGQILGILQAAHDKGIVHRDIKPSNIVVSDFNSRPSVRLLDFGIAKLTAEENAPSLTATGELLGTPLYMSPEQCVGDQIDHRADLYAVGCMLFEAVSGSSPFWAESSMSCMMKHVSEPPPDLREVGIDENYVQVIDKALQKIADDRYGSAAEFAQAVESLPDGYQTGTVVAPKAQKKKSRNTFGIVTGTVAVALVGLALLLYQTGLNHPAPPPAYEPPNLTDEKAPGDGEPILKITSVEQTPIELHETKQAVPPNFPMGGSGLAYDPQENVYFVFGRTPASPGYLRALYKIDDKGVVIARVPLKVAIPTSDGGNTQLQVELNNGNLKLAVPELHSAQQPAGWINLSVNPQTGDVQVLN